MAVPQLDLGAVGGAAAGHVQAAARTGAPDRSAVRGRCGGAAVECVEDGGVGRLLAAVVVEQQRRLLRSPGVAVAHTPDGDAEAARDGQAVVDHVGVGRGRGALDVEFGDGHVDAEGGEVLQGGAEVAVVGAAAVEVRLEADAVDRHAALLEVPHHVVHGLGLGPGPVLDVVVVVAELGGRVGGARGAEGDLDPVVAGALQVGVAPGARTAVGEGLVDDVPLRDLALVVGHHAVDVVDHRLAQRAAAEVLHPAGLLGVPGQGVAAHLLAVLHRPVVDAVGGGEVELAPLRLGGVDLHLVLGRHRVELTGRDRRVRRVAQPVPGDGDAEVAAALRRRGAERALGGLSGRRRDQCGDHTEDAGDQRQQQRADLPPDDGSGKGMRAHGCASKVGMTGSPDTAVMGPGRISTGTDGPGRPPSDVRRAAAVFRHGHGGTPSRLGREAVTRRRTPLLLRGGSGCVGASLTGTENGVAQVLWCVDPSCSRARLCGAAQPARASLFEISVYGRFTRQDDRGVDGDSSTLSTGKVPDPDAKFSTLPRGGWIHEPASRIANHLQVSGRRKGFPRPGGETVCGQIGDRP
ncbi:hypothetical protein SGRIM128S_06062 [Streptomyces griseomycini]